MNGARRDSEAYRANLKCEDRTLLDLERCMTPEEISEGYAGFMVARRWMATWVDLLVLLLLIGWIPNHFQPESTKEAVRLGCIGVGILYYPLLEGWTGRTAGKWLLRIKVVNDLGEVPGLGAAWIRTFFRLFEVNPILFGGLPAGLVALFSRTHQRLGDMAAHTFVLRDEDLLKLRRR